MADQPTDSAAPGATPPPIPSSHLLNHNNGDPDNDDMPPLMQTLDEQAQAHQNGDASGEHKLAALSKCARRKQQRYPPTVETIPTMYATESECRQVDDDDATGETAGKRAASGTDTVPVARAQEHALQTASRSGGLCTDQLRPFDVSTLAEADLVELLAHTSLEHMPRETAVRVIQRMGPEHAVLFGTQMAGLKKLMRSRGADPSTMPISLPAHPDEPLDPLRHTLSTCFELPFKHCMLPVLQEHLHKIIEDECGPVATWLLALPFLPMPIIAGGLPHMLFQMKFPPVLNSWFWLIQLQCLLIKLRRSSDMLNAETKQRLLSEHDERMTAWYSEFDPITEALLTHVNTTTGGIPSASVLNDFNELVCDAQLNFIRCMERTVASFYERVNQPAVRKTRAQIEADCAVLGADTATIGDLINAFEPSTEGIPPEYLDSMWTTLVKINHDALPEYVRPEVLAEIMEGVEQFSMKRLKVFDVLHPAPPQTDLTPAFVDTVLRFVPDARVVQPRFYSLQQIRRHWAVLMSEKPLADTQWFGEHVQQHDAALAQVANSGALPPLPELITDDDVGVPTGDVVSMTE